MSTRTLEVRFIGDAGQLNRTFAQVGQGAGKLDGTVSKSAKGLSAMSRAAAGLGLTIGAAGLARAAFSAADAAGDLNEQVSKSEAVFKGSAAEVNQWSETTADGIGISQTAALEATGTFGNMLVPMGLARDRAAEMSTEMVDLAGDMASFNNADPTRVLEALRSGLAGESEPLREFGVFLNAARVEQEALNLGLYDGTGAVSAAAKAQATYSLILKDTADAQGDFERTSGSAANQQRILAAEWDNAQAALGQALLPALVAGTGALRDGIGAARDHGDSILEVSKAAALAGGVLATYAGSVKAVGAASALAKVPSLGFTDALRLNPAALGLTAAAAIATYGAYVLLRDGADVGADSVRDATDALNANADAHRSTAEAVDANRDALERLQGTNLGQREARLRLEEATLRVAAAEATYGQGSTEYRRALLDQERAELGVTNARREHIKAAEEGIETSKATSAQVDAEVRQTQDTLASLRAKENAVRLGIITGKEAEKITKQVTVAERAAGAASETAAKKHRSNASELNAMAEAAGGATPKARALRNRLRELAEQELNLAAKIDALYAVGRAGDAAAAGVANVVRWMQELNNTPRLPGLSPGNVRSPYQPDYYGRGGENLIREALAADTAAQPTERDRREANAALAGLTVGTDDDIASAQAILGLSDEELAEAMRGGDAREIRTAAGNVSSARSTLQGLIDALKENTTATTEATKQSFGGSVAFASRGQEYVLRSLAPPSSDRLEGFV